MKTIDEKIKTANEIFGNSDDKGFFKVEPYTGKHLLSIKK